MSQRNGLTLLALLIAAMIALVVNTPAIVGQQSVTSKTASQDDDVVRIKTELVQTDVMVFDKQGRFVSGLRPEQFELSLEGKPRQISFFDRVTSGSATEAFQLAAVQNKQPAAQSNATVNGDDDAARIVFFFLDDIHLSESSIVRARKALLNFVEHQMSPNDRVAIVSTSGQIGFLQQLTDYKPTLEAAIGRINYKSKPQADGGKVPISDYQAIQIADHNDRDLFIYLVLATANQYQSRGALMRSAANEVKNRVNEISSQAKLQTNDVIGVLEGLMNSSAVLPGRKLVFFMSDGFVADPRGSNSMNLLKQVTSIAARAGVVVYTMDARGTLGSPEVEAGRNDFPDGMSTGTEARHPSLEAWATREPLQILADDTGGRAIFNDNSFEDAIQQAMSETSVYYLLAWRPDSDDQSGKTRIKVSVKDHPELRIRLRRNYYIARESDSSTKGDQKTAATAAPGTGETELLSALGTVYPRRTIPTELSVGYLNTPDGLVLRASMQIDRAALDLAPAGGKKTELDVIGAAVDDRGIIVSFKQLLTVTPDPSSEAQKNVVWNQQLRVQPGLYQVRMAVRERGSGHTGSAHQWIEVPDLGNPSLRLSSLFLGERTAELATNQHSPRAIMVDVNHRFAHTSVLRFQTYVYNGGHDGAPPAVEIRARVLRHNRAVVTTSAARLPIDTTGDLMRLPYWAEIALDKLPPGKYSLEVSAVDLTTRVTAIQEAYFIVE
jgi:VWFA-related protein